MKSFLALSMPRRTNAFTKADNVMKNTNAKVPATGCVSQRVGIPVIDESCATNKAV
jgi:hypothetical protein